MDTNIMDTITSYFEEGLEKIKFELSVAKDNLITEPFVELEQLKEQFNKTKVPALPNDYQEYYQDQVGLWLSVLEASYATASPFRENSTRIDFLLLRLAWPSIEF